MDIGGAVDRATARTASLTVVGTGIRLAAQLTPEARAHIERADQLLYMAAEPVGSAWLASLNPNARSLHTLYRPGAKRSEIYEAMVEQILDAVRRGGDVCVAFYGHPGVFVNPSHEAIRQARAEGVAARMLPGISAEDCLFADLGIDPATVGCQSYEATDFLLRKRRIDPSAALVLWQIATLGKLEYGHPDRTARSVLVEYLLRYYPSTHIGVLYEASPYPAVAPVADSVRLAELPEAEIGAVATLYVPPHQRRKADPEMLQRLGIDHRVDGR